MNIRYLVCSLVLLSGFAGASERKIASIAPSKTDCSVSVNFNYGLQDDSIQALRDRGFKGNFVNADIEKKPVSTEFIMYPILWSPQYFSFGTSAKDDAYVMQLTIEDSGGEVVWSTPILSCGREAKGTDHANYRYSATYSCYAKLAKTIPVCKKGLLVLE